MSRISGWIIRRLSELPTATVDSLPDHAALRVQLGGGPPVDLDVAAGLDLSSREAVERALASGRHDPRGRRSQLWTIEKLKPRDRQRLAEAGWSWIERQTGFLHLDAPPYYVHDQGTPATDASISRPGRQRPRPTKLVGLSGRCAETLIIWAGAQRATPDHGEPPEMTSGLLAKLAHVSLPLANKVLNRLAADQVIRPTQRKQRTLAWSITDPAQLLELWAAEDTRVPRITPAYVWARSPRDLLARLARLETVTDCWALGGVAAANYYAPILTAEPQPTLWIADTLPVETALRALNGEAVSEGANLTLQQMPNDPWALHRIRLHSEDQGGGWHPVIPRSVDARHQHDLWRAHTAPRGTPIPGLTLVSRPRAFVETHAEQRGRSDDVAEHLRSTLAFAP